MDMIGHNYKGVQGCLELFKVKVDIGYYNIGCFLMMENICKPSNGRGQKISLAGFVDKCSLSFHYVCVLSLSPAYM